MCDENEEVIEVILEIEDYYDNQKEVQSLSNFFKEYELVKFSGKVNKCILEEARKFCENKGITLNSLYERSLVDFMKTDIIFKTNDKEELKIVLDILKKKKKVINEKKHTSLICAIERIYNNNSITREYFLCLREIINEEFSELELDERKSLLSCFLNSHDLVKYIFDIK